MTNVPREDGRPVLVRLPCAPRALGEAPSPAVRDRGIRLCSAVLLSAALVACGGAEPERESGPGAEARPEPRLEERLGVAQRARDGTYCLAIANPALAAGTPVLLVSTRPPVRVDTAEVEAVREAACTQPGDEWGHAMIEDAAFYGVRLAPEAAPEDPTIAVAGRAALRAQGDSVVVGDVDGDGRPERFGACTSMEGVHLSVSTAGARRWHAYYYVPYDLEPDCPDPA